MSPSPLQITSYKFTFKLYKEAGESQNFNNWEERPPSNKFHLFVPVYSIFPCLLFAYFHLVPCRKDWSSQTRTEVFNRTYSRL